MHEDKNLFITSDADKRLEVTMHKLTLVNFFDICPLLECFFFDYYSLISTFLHIFLNFLLLTLEQHAGYFFLFFFKVSMEHSRSSF